MIPANAIPPCRDHGDLFFDEAHAGTVARAKALCAGCPVSAACLDYAQHWDVEGVWAGTTTKERRKLRKRAGIVPVPMTTNPQRFRGNAA